MLYPLSYEGAGPACYDIGGVRRPGIAYHRGVAFGFPDSRSIPVGEVDLAVVDRGRGHPVVFIHGFPELAYSWRHQIPPLAEAGYRCIAYDQRGFGASSKPEQIADYRLHELVADYTRLLDALDIERATIVGHDWGSIVAWTAALVVPDRVHSVVSLNVPYRGRCAGFPPISVLRERLAERFGYVLFFQEPGVAEAWFDSDPQGALQRFYAAAAAHTGFMSEEDFSVYLDGFRSGGIFGPVGLYRNIDRNWEEFSHLDDTIVERPALMIAADHDPVLPLSLVEGMGKWVRDLTVEVVADCGHWTQQERPDAVTDGLLGFLTTVTGHDSDGE